MDAHSISLSQEQEAAVKTESKKALVISAAGSGKTRTLIGRIEYLIRERHTSPYEIAAFSFTRKASQEVQSRLESQIGSESRKCITGTMHAIALNLLHRFGDLIGIRKKHLTVYSEFESDYLLRDTAIELGLYKKTWKIPKKDINAAFNDYYQTGIEPDKDHPCYQIFKAFIQRCKENNSMVYDALLVGFELLIPHIAKHLHLKHIIVDEVQDISMMQWRIINKLVEAFDASLFVVGDQSQCIYSWRFADPSYLIDHQNEFDIYHLSTNYRSTPEIVTAANNLIRHNDLRLPLEMKPVKGPWTFIKTMKNMDTEKICEFLKDENAVNAVLSRNHILLKKLSELLKESGIDHVYVGKRTALTNSEEFRRFHAFLKLIVNPYDNFAFLLIKDMVGLNNAKTEYPLLRLWASQEDLSHFQSWMLHYNYEWNGFFKLADKALTMDGIVTNLASRFEDGEFSEVFEFVNDWIGDNPAGLVNDYLDWLATYDLQDDLTEQEDKLLLGTVHSVKGLEFKTVLIIGCNEGLIPSKQAIASGDIESETRLMYVAITRAEDNLILAVRPEITESETGKIYNNPITRYIEWMGI